MAAHGAEVLALTGKVRREARLSLTQEIGDAIRRVVNSTVINSTVIASAAKQSRGHSTRPLDCFVARAPRNDGQWRHSRSPSRLSYFGASPKLDRDEISVSFESEK
jgi:hypothetical protein